MAEFPEPQTSGSTVSMPGSGATPRRGAAPQWRTHRRAARWAVGISLLVVLGAASCTSTPDASTTVPAADKAGTTVHGPGTSGVQVGPDTYHDPTMRMTTVNGQTPPGSPTFAKEQHDAVRTTDAAGNTVLTHYTVRAAGTRAPVHVHQLGGSTCLAQGEMTLYLEGAEPHRAVAGECYYMPSGRAMSGFNSGAVDAVMFDSFVLPPNTPEWVNLELDEAGSPAKSGP